MGKWLDLAARLEAGDGDGDNRDDRDNSPPSVPNVPADIPPHLQMGLVELKSMAAPLGVRGEVWPEVVSDALRLARDGWVTKSLALGWDPLDLFGAVVDRDGNNCEQGLAVWLRGRPVLALGASFASVSSEAGRAYFNRSTRLGLTLLWDIGRETPR